MIDIYLDNGKRSRELGRFTLQELKMASVDQENTVAVRSKDHKTYVKRGSTNIFLKQQTAHFIAMFIKQIRRNPASQDVFTSFAGKVLHSAHPRRFMQKVWEDRGASGEGPSQVGPTLIRKKVATSVHATRPHIRQ